MAEPETQLLPRATPLEVGERAPMFVLPAVSTDGDQFDVDLSKLLEARRVLLVFYEDDGMPICTRELQAFAQEFELLTNAGIQVLGINTNGVGSHQKFQERDRFPFPLVSDFYADAVRAYGMWDAEEKKSRRGVVAIARDGRVEYVLPHFNPGSVSSFEAVFRGLGVG